MVRVGCRMWDVDRDENYVLGLQLKDIIDSAEMITCVAYCSTKGWGTFCVQFSTVLV